MSRNVFLVTAILSLGCGGTTTTELPSRFGSLDVVGIVADNMARPVQNAQVAVNVVDPTLLIDVVQVGRCKGGNLHLAPTILLTDANGRFKATLSTFGAPSACVSVEVTPAIGSNLGPAAQSKAGVSFKHPEDGRDTANFNVVLAPGS